MNDLSNASSIQSHCYSCKPIPSQVLYVLVPLFFTGLAVSIFILIAVHNAFLFVSLLCLSALVAAFLIWNTVNWRRSRALFCYLRSFPDSDLRLARHGQLVKITGVIRISYYRQSILFVGFWFFVRLGSGIVKWEMGSWILGGVVLGVLLLAKMGNFNSRSKIFLGRN